jgi:hypothetical protein
MSEPQTTEPLGPIRHSLDLVGLTSHHDEPTAAVQYAVLAATGRRLIFGDQEWVRSGAALKDFPEGAVVQRREIAITYGEWGDAS